MRLEYAIKECQRRRKSTPIAGAIDIIDQMLIDLLTGSPDQISLMLGKENALKMIAASFALLHGGTIISTHVFSAFGNIFDDEDCTRASFRAQALAPVPLPAALPLLAAALAGFGLLGWSRKRVAAA